MLLFNLYTYASKLKLYGVGGVLVFLSFISYNDIGFIAWIKDRLTDCYLIDCYLTDYNLINY